MNLREQQKQETNKRIRDAIEKLVQEKSYESITIREICKEAGISIGTYYKHYQSKDDIIFQTIKNSAAKTGYEIKELLIGKNGYENMAIYIDFQMSIISVYNITWMREIFRTYLYGTNGQLMDRNSIHYKTILSIVNQGQEDGSIQSHIKAEDLAWMTLKSIIANFFSYCMESGDFDLIEVTKQEVLNMVKVQK